MNEQQLSQKTTSELVRSLKDEAGVLVSQHFELAKSELAEEAANALKNLRAEANSFVDEHLQQIKRDFEGVKVEAKEKLDKAVKNATYMSAGGLMCQSGFIVFLIALALGINSAMSSTPVPDIYSWVGPLIVGFVALLTGFMFIQKGKSGIEKQTFIPKQSLQKLRENQKWPTKPHMTGSI